MSTSPIAVVAPKSSFLFSATSLPGITAASSRLQIMLAFLATSGGAIVGRLQEFSNGLVFITTIPEEANSGAIYVYSSVRGSFFMLEIDGRDSDFSIEEFDALIKAGVLEGVLAPGAWLATRRPARQGHKKPHASRYTRVNENVARQAVSA